MALRYYHFSVDDVLAGVEGLRTATQTQTAGWLLDYCSSLNDEFGSQIDLYLFLRQPGFSLADLPDNLVRWFADRSWLRLGPHALDNETPPHAQTLEDQATFLNCTFRQITRFAGLSRVSAWVRLHYFSECFEHASLLNQYGTSGLFTTDKPTISYRLPAAQIEMLRTSGKTVYQGCELIRSHVRIENLVGRPLTNQELEAELIALIGDAECAVIFTHEYELLRPEVRDMTRRVFQWIQYRNLQPLFSSTEQGRRSSPLCFDEAS